MSTAGDGMSMIFATPLIVRDWTDSAAMNADLAALMTKQRQAGPGLGKSNVGGWHSAADFINGDTPALAALRQRIRDVIIDVTRQVMVPGNYHFKVDGWANILGPGDYNGPHNHPNATWSGVYYLTGVPGSAAQHDLAGKIEFFDPRPAAGMLHSADNMLQRRCLFTPRPGCMLVFRPGCTTWFTRMAAWGIGCPSRLMLLLMTSKNFFLKKRNKKLVACASGACRHTRRQ